MRPLALQDRMYTATWTLTEEVGHGLTDAPARATYWNSRPLAVGDKSGMGSRAGWNLNRYSGKMDWRVPSISLMILYSALSASGVEAAVVAPPGLVQAEERMKELVDLFSDIRCSIRPRHCADNFQAGQTVSGLYKIFLGKDDVTGKVVYCDMDTDGGGWTVIQRRGQFGNSVYYFYRNWTEYATGFGDPAKEYWLGWDSLYNCNHSKFSTFDQDHDNTEYHCAEKYRGGWWYNNCHSANLNGLNLNGPHDSYADGIEWSIRNGVGFLYHYSYPSVTMMIRPVTLNKNHESGYL
ncbi:techylectin-5A-like isoform X5 [Dermacentor albipictus]|uniref:techylectin-5A-like isoform X5 n=1 Tax=Dermacentor albipictus TaxID=60249 RepID=UPI0031FC81B9